MSDRHKYHYFEEGLSLCLKYAWYPVDDEEYDDIRVEWVSTEIDNTHVDIKMDDRLCLRCQIYHEVGKCGPHDKYLKCDYCGRFGARYERLDWNWSREDVDEVYLCKECGTWSDRIENSGSELTSTE